jgi:hypothetical protein
LRDKWTEVICVVSGVRRRQRTEEQDKADRRRIRDTTPCTKPLAGTYGDWFPVCSEIRGREVCVGPQVRRRFCAWHTAISGGCGVAAGLSRVWTAYDGTRSLKSPIGGLPGRGMWGAAIMLLRRIQPWRLVQCCTFRQWQRWLPFDHMEVADFANRADRFMALDEDRR